MEAKRLGLLVLALVLAIAGCKKRHSESAAQIPQDTTPGARLHLAARKGDLELVQSLIAGGCDVDARDTHGRTPLYTATRYAQAAVVEFLISKGADVNIKNAEGETLLDEAIARGFEDIAELLRRHTEK